MLVLISRTIVCKIERHFLNNIKPTKLKHEGDSVTLKIARIYTSFALSMQNDLTS